MKCIVLSFLLVLASAGLNGSPKRATRTIPCKTPEVAGACFSVRGRLSVANGNPSYRLWRIGSHHLFGIYSGPASFGHRGEAKYALDNEGPELPANVEEALWRGVRGAWPNTIYGDFYICPLEAKKMDAMQAACIESAKNLTIKKSE